MTQEKKSSMMSVLGGAAVGLLVIFGGRAIDSILNTDTIKEIKEEIKEVRHEIRELRTDFVLKKDYDSDKQTMINLIRRK